MTIFASFGPQGPTLRRPAKGDGIPTLGVGLDGSEESNPLVFTKVAHTCLNEMALAKVCLPVLGGREAQGGEIVQGDNPAVGGEKGADYYKPAGGVPHVTT